MKALTLMATLVLGMAASVAQAGAYHAQGSVVDKVQHGQNVVMLQAAPTSQRHARHHKQQRTNTVVIIAAPHAVKKVVKKPVVVKKVVKKPVVAKKVVVVKKVVVIKRPAVRPHHKQYRPSHVNQVMLMAATAKQYR